MKSILPTLCLLACSASIAGDIEPVAINLDELEWGPPGGGNGFPLGVRTARQGVDPVSGGKTYYSMFPAGSHFDLHWHTHDEYVVVVAGTPTIRLGDRDHVLTVGSYVVIPGGLNHSWTVPEGASEAVILVRRAGPADFHFVEDRRLPEYVTMCVTEIAHEPWRDSHGLQHQQVATTPGAARR